MSNLGKTSKDTLIKCAATIKDEEGDFDVFEGVKYLIFMEDNPSKFYINIRTATNEYDLLQEFSFHIPKEGDVLDKIYTITQNPNHPSEVYAIWSKSSSSAQINYTATEGSLKLTLNNSTKTVKATFSFTGQNRGKKVVVTEGTLEIEGFVETTKNDAAGQVVCDLSRDVVARYESRETHLSIDSKNHIVGWSRAFASKPDVHDYRIAISIAKGHPIGTYDISVDNDKVSVFFYNINGDYIYQGEQGRLTISSLPSVDSENSPSGTFAGAFYFVAGATDASGGRHFVEAKNGTFSITN